MSDVPWSSLLVSPTAEQPPLRIGVAVDPDGTLSRAQAAILDDILVSAVAVVVLLIVNDRLQSRRRESLGWRLYRALDRRRTLTVDEPEARLPIPTTLAGLPRASVVSAAGSDLDVVLDLSRAGATSAIASLARHGAWRQTSWVSLRDHLIHVTLRREGSADRPGVVLASGAFANDPMALASSRASAAYGSAHLAAQTLASVQREGRLPNAPGAPTTAGTRAPSARRSGTPTTWEVMRWIGPVVASRFLDRTRRSVRRSPTVEHWRIAMRRDHGASHRSSRFDMSGFHWLESPKGHLYADPFLIERGDRTWLFFEDYTYADRRGVIATAEVGSEGTIGATAVAIAGPGHLSYPYLFAHEDTMYLIPESGAEGVVRLFRATAFPTDWEPIATLHEGSAVDTSAIQHDGRWWFFTTLREPRGGATMLMLYSSDDLAGPWESHPMNPVSLDVRDARGAGRIFEQDGRLIRPNQDCSRTYGFSFGFNEIVTMTRTTYVERRLATIHPSWHRGLTATHSYARAGGFEATDGRMERDRHQVV